MTRPKNHWWESLGKPCDDKAARLQQVSHDKNEWCNYRDSCLSMAANAERRIDELAAEELALVEALQAQEGET